MHQRRDRYIIITMIHFDVMTFQDMIKINFL